jgi:chromosome segregation ATPase
MIDDSKALFDYWYDRVQLKNLSLIAAPGHIATYELRHECTNYDQLRSSAAVLALQEPERTKIITIIKYQCTAQVLQRRAGLLRDQSADFEQRWQALSQERSNFSALIQQFQRKLFGKDKEVKKLEIQVAGLQAEKESLQAELQQSQAYAELQQAFEKLKKEHERTQEKRAELAKNNQRLGGRVAHTNRFQRERDEARSCVVEQKQQIQRLVQEVQQLRQQLSEQ